MKLMKNALSAAVLVAGGAAALFPGSTIARPAYSIETIYYSDASHTVEVGTRMLNCSGQNSSTGEKTPYYFTTHESCN
jgi:hypothetical protein